MRRLALGAALALTLALACTSPPRGRLVVEDAFARASAPGAPNAAAFMTLRAEGGEVTLSGARSDVSEVTELHGHFEDDGVMRMRQIPRVVVPEGGVVRLEPGGLHVMLIGLKAPLVAGSTLTLELELAGGGAHAVRAPVRALTEVPGRPASAPASRASGPGSRPASAPASRPGAEAAK